MESKNKQTINFYKTSLEEQESLINIDYYGKEVIVYTSKKSIFIRIKNKIGEPSRIFNVKGQISGAEWRIPFKEKKKITSILSRHLLIGKRE